MGFSVFQSLVAQEIQKRQCVHLGIDPTDILNQVEANKFDTGISGAEEIIASRQVGRRLLDYIASRWKDEQTLEILSQELTMLISQSIERARKEKTPELEGNELPRIQESVSRSEDPLPSVLVHQSTEQVTAVAAETVESDSERSSTTSSILGGNAEPTHQERSNLEPSQYTSLLWEHAAKIGSVPEFKKKQHSLFPAHWTCTVTFVGLSENGEGRNSKMAMHEASRQLYFKLDLAG